MRLALPPVIPGDLEEIAEFTALDTPHYAARTVRLIRARMREIAERPEIYRLRLEIGVGARLASVGQSAILLRIRPNVVRTERVVHGGRDLPPILGGADT